MNKKLGKLESLDSQLNLLNDKTEILANFEFLLYQICQETAEKIATFHSLFQIRSKQEGRNNEF